MGTAACCFCSGMLARLSPDSARTTNPVETRTAAHRINLAAFDIFMLLLLFCAPAFLDSLFKTETHLALCDSTPGYCASASKKRKQNVSTAARKR